MPSVVWMCAWVLPSGSIWLIMLHVDADHVIFPHSYGLFAFGHVTNWRILAGFLPHFIIAVSVRETTSPELLLAMIFHWPPVSIFIGQGSYGSGQVGLFICFIFIFIIIYSVHFEVIPIRYLGLGFIISVLSEGQQTNIVYISQVFISHVRSINETNQTNAVFCFIHPTRLHK